MRGVGGSPAARERGLGERTPRILSYHPPPPQGPRARAALTATDGGQRGVNASRRAGPTLHACGPRAATPRPPAPLHAAPCRGRRISTRACPPPHRPRHRGRGHTRRVSGKAPRCRPGSGPCGPHSGPSGWLCPPPILQSGHGPPPPRAGPRAGPGLPGRPLPASRLAVTSKFCASNFPPTG